MRCALYLITDGERVCDQEFVRNVCRIAVGTGRGVISIFTKPFTLRPNQPVLPVNGMFWHKKGVVLVVDLTKGTPVDGSTVTGTAL